MRSGQHRRLLLAVLDDLAVIGATEHAVQLAQRCGALHRRSAEIDNQQAYVWCDLGTCGGGVVGGRKYSRSQCFVESLEMGDQGTHADLAWTSLGGLGGGRRG